MRDTLRRIAESGDESTPVVLVGDFNVPSHLDRPTWSPIHAAHEDGSGLPEPQDRID